MIKRLLNHAVLWIILIGSDLFIAFTSHYQGTGLSFLEYIQTADPSDLFIVFFIAIVISLYVELRFKRS